MSSGSALLNDGVDVCLHLLVSTSVESLFTLVVQTYKISSMIRSLG